MKKEQIEEIISKMTLHEKVLLCTGKNSWRTRDYEKLGIPSILVSDGTSGVRLVLISQRRCLFMTALVAVLTMRKPCHVHTEPLVFQVALLLPLHGIQS